MASPSQSVGKRVGGFLYVHRDALDLIDPKLSQLVARCAESVPDLPWNVAKLSPSEVSLLVYEDFDKAAFPALLKSAKVDPVTGYVTKRDYEGRDSPPILHRKEILLRPDDPRIPKFSALTADAEAHGLFKNSNSIGTKRKWEERLKEAGVRVMGQVLLAINDSLVDVARHRTAIARRDLSQPMQLMMRLGIIRREFSIFDYGCGQGDDVALLQGNGYEAFGWDPHHAPDGPRRKADVVNLGFVLNVIENPHERIQTLKAAWSFAKRVLTVAVMPAGKYQVSGLTPYKDGFLTSRGTFQRYFLQDDLRELAAATTDMTPISLAPGIVALFRDKELEQEVAYRRRSRASILSEAFHDVPRQRPSTATTVAPPIRDRIAPQLKAIWRIALDLGRHPDASEVPPEVIGALSEARVSFERAITLCIESFDPNTLKEATEARREDLLVHFAISLLPGAPRYAMLPRSIQRDVRTFFGSHSAAMEKARGLLFSVGDPGKIKASIKGALEQGLGGACNGSFRFLSSVLPRMPAVVRVVVGCAEVIETDLGSYDFLEIAPDEGLVRGLRCDDVTKALPIVVEIVEVDLKALRRKRKQPKGMVLYLKGRYLPSDDPAQADQQKIDDKLIQASIVSTDGVGPDAASLARMLMSTKSRTKT
ncbi:DNA phosphorothioation-associated putative methyltransferase [Microvirga sp. KLBC 81]|uniref:DNA phosphorothioation-associated putative methyltransferase n=1 Tax=Microvirga sp. KLBC 81 TaxID=1862707 RepID=UPI001403593C|nr:DNA phosphorothioation-associated putative methyltransferase [Microvirga sp. KLBC 81]